jgi:curved DNA-binding protein CbpA
MKDHFALLGQPRRPWLDAETIQQGFVRAAAEVHPDRVHDAPESVRQSAHDRYTELNAAQLCLRDVRTRLRHLLELERGRKVVDLQEIPEALMALFERLGRQLKAADQHLREVAQATSPLLKVGLFEQGETLREQLRQTQAILHQHRQELEGHLRVLNDQWERLAGDDAEARERLLRDLETLYRLISFHDRWRAQVQERLLKLMDAG